MADPEIANDNDLVPRVQEQPAKKANQYLCCGSCLLFLGMIMFISSLDIRLVATNTTNSERSQPINSSNLHHVAAMHIHIQAVTFMLMLLTCFACTIIMIYLTSICTYNVQEKNTNYNVTDSETEM